MAAGAVHLKYGRIDGRCGYVDAATRTVVLNPDASPEQLLAELGHDLTALVAPAVPRPCLAVVDGDLPDHAPPRHPHRADDAEDEAAPAVRVAE